MIHYIKGDATFPVVEDGVRVIAHVVNDEGKWGRGFVKAISARWKGPENYYLKQSKWAKSFKLGEVQWVFVDVDLGVCNMIAQRGVRSFVNVRPIQYDHLEVCLEKMAESARYTAGLSDQSMKTKRLSIHMPRIGCGLGGGDWSEVGELVEETCWDLDVYVYDLEK